MGTKADIGKGNDKDVNFGLCDLIAKTSKVRNEHLAQQLDLVSIVAPASRRFERRRLFDGGIVVARDR